ncbi:retrotransposon protein, putative, ty1-copia subclass [Tanacetum coccineum]
MLCGSLLECPPLVGSGQWFDFPSTYSVFELKHEKQVQAVKVNSVNLPSEEGIVQVTGNDNSEKLFREEEGNGIHIVGMHAHAAQHRHNHASRQVALEVDALYRSIVPSMRTKRKLMYDSVSVLEVGSSSKKQSIASKVGLQHESNLPSICNDVLEMEYMCTNPGRRGRNENTHISDSYDDAFTATSKEQFSSVDTPEVLLRTVALRHTASFLELCSLVKADIEKGEVTNISVDNIEIGDPSVEDFSWKLTQNLLGEELLQMADKGTKRKKPREGGMKREEIKFKKYVRMVATAQNTNNTTIRSIFQHEKLSGPNFTNWYRNLRIVLRSEGKLAHLEQPLIPLPYPRALENYKAYDMIQELRIMFEKQAKQELIETVKTFHACKQEEGKTIAELHVMLKLHEKGIPKKAETPAMLAIREGKIQKDKRKPRWAKGKDKGNNKLAYAPKPKILSPPKRDNPKKDSICHHCKEVGHWRRNYLSCQAELKKREEASMASTSGTFTIELYAEFFEDNLIVQEASGSHRPLKMSRSDEGLELIQEEDTQPFENTSEEHNEVVPMEYELGDLNKPPNYKVALSDPEYDKWLEAINTEMQSIKDNQVWVLVELPPNGRTVGSKWLFKKKTDMDGNVHTFKARIRAIRILLAIITFYDNEIWQMDVKTAFLNGHLSEDVYMVQPEGFMDPNHPNKVCKLQHSIYGLKQSSKSVYLKASESSVAFLILYVDDILLMGNNVTMLQEVKSWLSKCFSMKDLGEAAYILRNKIIHDRSKRLIAVSQSAYLEKILKKFRMENSKKGYTPIMKKPNYRKSQGAKIPSERTVGSKWLFKKKTDMDGNVHTFKARIRAIRIVLAITTFYDYDIWQMDVKTAFLNGHLSEDVYMVQPEGFVDPNHPNKVCKLQHSIYGLKQASKSWNKRFDVEIKKIGFTQNPNEPGVYLKASGSSVAFLILYVNDILLMGNNVTMLQEVKSWLSKCFSMKDLGEAAYILGNKIIRDRSKRLISLSQSAYLEKILKKFRMENSKKGYTPIMKKPDYRKSQGAKTPSEIQRMQRVPYDSAIGEDDDEAAWREDVADVETAVKTILKYLRNTKDMVLVYGAKPEAELKVSCYTDASFQTDKDDTKSQTGYVFVLNVGAVDWNSTKQSTTAMSSTEAEYIAAAEVSMEAVWMRKFIDGLGDVVPSNKRPMEMLCDNEPTIAIAADLSILKEARHFQRKYHYIREVIQEREIVLKKVHTDDNVADPFTKLM